MFQAQLGSISTGTLRHQDLLGTFAGQLEWCMAQAAKTQTGNLTREEQAWIKKKETLIRDARALTSNGAGVADDQDDLLGELMDALEEYAPPYCYFGPHPGDGADFGFWPNREAIDELPKVRNNTDEEITKATKDGDCVYVNDHGNLTIYSSISHKPILELV